MTKLEKDTKVLIDSKIELVEELDFYRSQDLNNEVPEDDEEYDFCMDSDTVLSKAKSTIRKLSSFNQQPA